MIEGLPFWIDLLFLGTVAAAIFLFYLANGKEIKILIALLAWSVFQSILALVGFYQVTDSMPPRFVLVLLPSTLVMVLGLLSPIRNKVLAKRDMRISTFLHTVRVPVEIVLLFLYFHKMVPVLMTFEGRNFDILAGLSAPLVGLLWGMNRQLKGLLLAWNFVSLGLVLFILFNGILSSELPFQQFGFEQPNRAINYFPFILLPAVVVPLVVYTHITDIILLLRELREVRKKRGKVAHP